MLSFNFARRYLISKKSTHAINIISAVAACGMLVGSAGLILVLSVFNGFESKVESLYSNFYPPLLVQPAMGKTIVLDSLLTEKIKKLPGIETVSLTLEDKVLLTTENAQLPGLIKGVDESYTKLNDIGHYLVSGEYALAQDSDSYAVVGVSVMQKLNIRPDDFLNGGNILTLNYPRKRTGSTGFITDDFSSRAIVVKGAFAVQQDFDEKYVLVPLTVAQQLLESEGKISAYEIAVKKNATVNSVKKELVEMLGPGVKIKSRFEQNETLYKVMHTEKWAVYAILTFILIVAAFNIIGSLSMLVIEKKKDISILKTMGAGNALIRNIFLAEGSLLCIAGCITGFIISAGLCLIQIYFKVIKIPGKSFAFTEYPVQLQWQDFVLVFFTVISIGMLASWLPAARAAKTGTFKKEE